MTNFPNRAIWESYSPARLEKFAREIFEHYREHGFPYFPTDAKWRNKEWLKMHNYDHTTLINRGHQIIGQSMHGLGLCWSYQPHSFAVKCNGKLSPMELYEDDALFMAVIKKRLKIGAYMTDSGMRKMLRSYTNAQSVSNFRPTAAAAFLTAMRVHPTETLTVWDMSAGYGGRMLGADITSDYYIGTDPCVETYNGLVQMQKDFRIAGQLHNVGSEDFNTPMGVDLCFTSPPYFDTEKYSDEPTQSFIKYPTLDKWLDGYWRQTIRNCHAALNQFGKLAVNIADVKSVPGLAKAVCDVITSNGFRTHACWNLSLSRMPTSTKQRGAASFKYEPIYIFERRSQ